VTEYDWEQYLNFCGQAFFANSVSKNIGASELAGNFKRAIRCDVTITDPGLVRGAGRGAFL